ncbi:hypothetical protein CLPU_3c00950 [Gottschalkia purinilytica]|uniref:Phage replisome organiser N-terminal domain-containing protein n=1 Tax=Gottschalkia purinilytica TaxID=1503 RepID=A0A0L0WCW9_GOTPU|nr:phage replisome organizer N-terminal domain-containing protein [Gottschalkia purinilytica]KNF09317.1 hypothetical protein CLPU_3c00950 [Gottschalkia purinilytica]
MSNKGWIKLHRHLMDKAIWIDSTPEQKTILITLLMMANHKVKEWEWKGEKYVAKPGQFVTSLEKIAINAGKGVSIQNVRTALKKFEKYGFLTNESTNKNRLITIENWESYQCKDEELTSNQQATNKRLTTNKNVKNEKNDIYILTQNEEDFLKVLNTIDNYPFDREKDLKMYHTLKERYEQLDMLEAIKQWSAYKLDEPLKAKSNARSQINTAFKKYIEWGKCLKENKQDNEANYDYNWRGTDRRF